jgi:TolB-like protein/DNA-binding winged helix-turn-helix (wHTH) protein/Flp pilus assembly protein TadD
MISPSQLSHGFRLGPWQVEPRRGAITGPDGETRHLEPKVMEVLAILAGTPGELVTRDHLLDTVWRGQPGADQLLTHAVSQLRRVLEDRRDRPAYIETVPKRGYRLIGDVGHLVTIAATEPAAPAVPAVPSMRYRAALAASTFLVIAVAIAAVWLGRGNDRAENFGPPVTRFDDRSPSVAVLPFTNLSGDPSNDYFSDGLSEEIRNLLAQVPDLKVIGRTSSFSFRDTSKGPQAVGRALGVGAILEGSVRKSADRVRITARLIDTSDGSDVWSESYDRPMTDIFELQDDVASAIIDALKIHIGAYPARGRPTEVADAYALFLKARLALHVNDVQTAATALRQAVTLDPDFAEAYELLAFTYWTDYLPAGSPIEQLVHDSAGKALALDPDLDFARALYLEGDPGNPVAATLEAYRRAARRQPNNPEILRILSWKLAITGYLSEALAVIERFVQLEPLSSKAHDRRSAVLAALGRDEEAQAAMGIAERLNPGLSKWVIGETHLIRGRDETAIAYFEADVEADGGDTAWIQDLVTATRESGRAALDERVAAVLAATPEAAVADTRFELNRLYLLFGFLDRYFELILDDQRVSPREREYYVMWGTVYRQWGFTAHPRYPEVARLMGFTEAWERRGPPDYCEAESGEWVCR